MAETDSASTLADGLFWLKTMYGVIMLVVAFGCGLLPWRVRRGGHALLSQATAFSGGVFLGAAFLHLLSEAADAQFWRSRTGNFPTPYLLCIVGFLLVMAFEEEFMVELDDADAEKIHTVPDAISFFSTHPMAK